jgi:hypothetical protein
MNVDLRLFVDPLLLPRSKAPEMQAGAAPRIQKFFEEIIELLAASTAPGDIAWRAARQRMRFHEVSGTCLGYGAATIRGSGMGSGKAEKILGTAKEMVDLGLRDPDLFLLLPLLEEKIGSDLVSDMMTNIIQEDLAKFTARVLRNTTVPTEEFRIGRGIWRLPRNPCLLKRTPVLLVPSDVVAELPVALSREDVKWVVEHNEELRDRVNQHISGIWRSRALRDKRELRASALASLDALTALLEVVRTSPHLAYDLKKDRLGLLVWRRVLETVATQYPLKLESPASPDAGAVFSVAQAIIKQFAHLIEDREQWRLLWDGTKPHHEHVAQMLFFAVAESYCKANNLDITPEADTGTGAVDFKVSSGHAARVLVEIKLSRNTKLVAGYTKQLEIYKRAECTDCAAYVVVDVGGMGKKDAQLRKLRKDLTARGKRASDLCFIDGSRRKSASKA